MRFFISKSLLLTLLQVYGIYSYDVKLVLERVKSLETRIQTESKFRDADNAIIVDRLDEIDSKLDKSLKQREGFKNVDRGFSGVGAEQMKEITENVQTIERAFREEKLETARIRREIPQLENEISSVKRDVTNYCIANTNKTEELINSVRVEVVQQGVKSSEEIRSLANSVSEEQSKSLEMIQKIRMDVVQQGKTSSEEIRSLRSLTNSVNKEHAMSLEIVQKIDENADKIAKIENVLTDLSSNLEYLFILKPIRSCAAGFFFPSGIYKLYNSIEVYCDQTTDGGGWIVFQRRISGEVDFYRNWTEYKHGFGNLDGEFWLGNENLNLLTRSGESELRIEMEDFDGNKAYAKYSKFKIHSESDKYRLEVSGYSGNAGDSLDYHDGMSFTTYDSDNDRDSENCAKTWHGAWWYNGCHYSNLNGKYYNENGKMDYKGVNWYHWKKNSYCLKHVEMKLR